MPANSKPKFADNEKVLCYHGPLLYEAKCVKSKKDPKAGANGEYQYFVHYQGWNKNWDEWVGESRILKGSQDNLERKDKLLAQHVAAVKDKKKSSKSGSGGGGGVVVGRGPPPGGPLGGAGGRGGSGSGSSGQSSKKSDSANTSRASTPVSEPSSTSKTPSVSVKAAKHQQRVLEEDELSNSSREEELTQSKGRNKKARLEPEEPSLPFRLVLPEELKYVLVSDWDLVNSRNSLFNLPARTTISAILNDYLKYAEKRQQPKYSVVSDVLPGIKDAFDSLIGVQLLYRIEQPQYDEVMLAAEKDGGKKKQPCDVYGSAHLLRLMAKINGLLNTNMIDNEADASVVSSVLKAFLTYLEANRTKYFTSKNYVEASEEYLRKVAEASSTAVAE